uniref:Recombination and repair protein Rac prophage (Modular protein) n=1 Tax=mine drainage metagenome TaxID=410659 RepID=E6QW64_9ZZZZ
MSLQALRNIRNTNSNAGKETQQSNFPAMLEQYKGEIARALPKHINPDRMARIALTAFRMTPKLAECDPRSVFAAVIQSSQLGLEIGLMGEAHLVPFGGQCQLIPGYTGLMKLARNSGLVTDIYAEVVRLNDKFSLTLGMERNLEHTPLTSPGGFPASDEERGEVAGFYAVGVLKDGSRTFVAMGRPEIERIRDGSRGYQAAKKYKKESLWDTDFASMGLKTAIRRLCKYLPKSPELATALVIDDQAGRQKFILDDVINGSYTPVVDEETGEILGQDGNGEVTDVASQSKAPETVIIGGLTATETKAGEGVTAFVMDPSRQPQQPMTKIEKLDKVVAAMRAANTLEVLDEIYVRAEGSLDDAQLEVAMREYRKCKDAMDEQGSLI